MKVQLDYGGDEEEALDEQVAFTIKLLQSSDKGKGKYLVEFIRKNGNPM